MLIIWGVVGYKLYNNISFDSDQQVLVNTAQPLQLRLTKKSSFDKKDFERDPFLNSYSRKRERPSVNQKQTNKVTSRPNRININSKQDSKFVWPVMIYYGFVRNHSKTKRGIVSFNGVSKKVRQGESIDGIKIKELTKNKITLQYKGENKTILKKAL